MKILDRYILTTYLKTFISVFLILMLIFILQAIWLYIKELAGKDLDISVIVKFLIYVGPTLIPLILPLSILLTSIMVFGSFAENYEFAAMKSTGISLQRAMSGLGVFIVILGFTTFLFSNNVIPWANYNFFNLRKNIAKVKPSVAISEGQFNAIGEDFNIKVQKKSGDKGQYLENVVIHIKGANKNVNAKIIKSKTGELIGVETSNVIKLILFDGNYYEDIQPKAIKARKKNPFAKSSFKKYTMNLDISQLNAGVDIDEKTQDNRYNMLNVGELNYTIDSLKQQRTNDHNDLSKILYQRTSINLKTKAPSSIKKEDSINTVDILTVFDTKSKLQLVDIALNNINSTKQIITTKENSTKISKSEFNKHVISFHEKFALGFACVILFFVGAPLGALIRKGGIGLPMVIAIVLFLTYHFIGIFATNSAKSGNLNPVLASWFSTLVMFPLGVFLTKRATADKGLFEFGNILEPLKNMFKTKDKNKVDLNFLSSAKNEELIVIINNDGKIEHDENTRYEALKVLNERSISTKELRENGVRIHLDFDVSEKISKDYKEHAKFALVLYIIAIALLVLHFIFKNNKLPSLQSASIQLSFVSILLFIIYYIKSLINISKFNNHINKRNNLPNLFLLILGFPLYIITHLFYKLILKEDLKQNCLDSLK